MRRIILTRLFVRMHQDSVTTWPSLPRRHTNRQRPTIERINESRCQIPNPPKRDEEGVRETVSGELSQERAGLHWPQILAAALSPIEGFWQRVCSRCSIFDHPLGSFPRHLSPTAVPFAVAKKFAVQAETLQYTPQTQLASIHIHLERCARLLCVLG